MSLILSEETPMTQVFWGPPDESGPDNWYIILFLFLEGSRDFDYGVLHGSTHFDKSIRSKETSSTGSRDMGVFRFIRLYLMTHYDDRKDWVKFI